MKFLKNIKPNIRVFLIRTAIFFVLFIVIFQGLPEITNMIYGYSLESAQPYFALLVYPLFLIFSVIRWKKIKTLEHYKNKLIPTMIFILLAALAFLSPIKGILISFPEIPPPIVYYLPMLIGYSFLFVGIYGLKFVKTFSSELFLIVLIFVLYLISQLLIEMYWQIFSNIILFFLGFILPIFTKSLMIDPNQYLIVMENFHVLIGPPCSGIYSLTTFLFLFVAAVFMLKEKVKIHFWKTAAALLFGLLLIFLLNILRIVIIIYVGAFHSPELAIELFHEYLSSIFFIALFVAYLYFVFPRIVKK